MNHYSSWNFELDGVSFVARQYPDNDHGAQIVGAGMKTGFWKYQRYCSKLDRAFERSLQKGRKTYGQIAAQYDRLNDMASRLYWPQA
jgi:hypothetical protein